MAKYSDLDKRIWKAHIVKVVFFNYVAISRPNYVTEIFLKIS